MQFPKVRKGWVMKSIRAMRNAIPNYLITGGAGFIGGYLSEQLLEQGNAVAVIDDLSTGSIDNLEGSRKYDRFS